MEKKGREGQEECVRREVEERRLLLDSNGPERGAVKRSSTLLAVNPRCEEAGKKLIAAIRLIKRQHVVSLSLSHSLTHSYTVPAIARPTRRDLSISLALIARRNTVSLDDGSCFLMTVWKLRIGSTREQDLLGRSSSSSSSGSPGCFRVYGHN